MPYWNWKVPVRESIASVKWKIKSSSNCWSIFTIHAHKVGKNILLMNNNNRSWVKMQKYPSDGCWGQRPNICIGNKALFLSVVDARCFSPSGLPIREQIECNWLDLSGLSSRLLLKTQGSLFHGKNKIKTTNASKNHQGRSIAARKMCTIEGRWRRQKRTSHAFLDERVRTEEGKKTHTLQAKAMITRLSAKPFPCVLIIMK